RPGRRLPGVHGVPPEGRAAPDRADRSRAPQADGLGEVPRLRLRRGLVRPLTGPTAGPLGQDPPGPDGLGVVPGVGAVLEEAGVRLDVRRPVRDAGVWTPGRDRA